MPFWFADRFPPMDVYMPAPNISAISSCLAYILSLYPVSMSTTKRPRGGVTKDKSLSKAILVYFPKELLPLIDAGVRMTDSDRSKFIRNSVREKLSSLGATTAS